MKKKSEYKWKEIMLKGGDGGHSFAIVAWLICFNLFDKTKVIWHIHMYYSIVLFNNNWCISQINLITTSFCCLILRKKDTFFFDEM